ncbi:c-type cytochrome [Magnetospirillum aberrantis]|uniref:Cytochrome c n=1 Tax=Magnetospirillum aberrantis SpK TaxID=908842 RepID=A0A7C9UWX8_9PROT|nr:cytochrome c [Magnetospirillum aberrantis]NFV81009.1 cytochrome c [Magnetospirillum aberrantis SpK]
MTAALRLVAMLGAVALSVPAVAAEPPPNRQAELLALLHQDCGSCHGMTLRGGLGLPLTPERMDALSVESISETILSGRPGTAMPPWAPFMTADEARWLATQLQTGGNPP